jgi:hypothetical protein
MLNRQGRLEASKMMIKGFSGHRESCQQQWGSKRKGEESRTRANRSSDERGATGVTATAPTEGWHHLHVRLIKKVQQYRYDEIKSQIIISWCALTPSRRIACQNLQIH